MQRIREFLTLALLALLPLHALSVTVGTNILRGAGHAPWGAWAIWKEGLLAFILLIAFLETSVFAVSRKLKVESGKCPPATCLPARQGRAGKMKNEKWDIVDILVAALIILAVIVSILNPSFSILNFAFGFKYDFIPLVAFLVIRRVKWSQCFWMQAERLLLAVGGVVALYGILTFFLPAGFFAALGYSDAHSLYLPDGPIAAFQHISGSGIRRIQGTFSGPNQFGVWLLIPISVCLARMMQLGEKLKMKNEKWTTDNSLFTFYFSLFILLVVALLLTFSRSAWIAAFVIGCISAWRIIPKKFFAFCMGSFLMLAIGMSLLFPPVFIRPISLAGHVERPLKAVITMIKHPFGLGLGSAGPAANRTNDSCVFLEPGSDPAWARENAGLCVFVGGEQVQPSDRRCDCPLLTENWYLQIGVELGVFGFLFYGGLILLVLRRLAEGERRKEKAENTFSILHSPFSIFLAFLGISIAALFLHAWEDSAVAYTAWILAAATLYRQSLIQDRHN